MSDEYFKPKLGKPQSHRGIQTGRVSRLVAKVTAKRVKSKSPWANALTKRPVAELARGKGALYGLTPPPQGWRRVVVKVSIARHGTTNLAAARSHQHYLTRDGVGHEGAPAQMYDHEHDIADGGPFLDAQKSDTYQFRMIVAPEDASRMADLKPFVRDLMARMERDLHTELDWVAVDHHNTGHPHTHVIIAGHDDKGDDLVMARDYISHGIRSRARDLVTRELGPEQEYERVIKLGNEVKADRFTSIDRGFVADAEDNVLVIKARPDGDRYRAAARVGRLRRLEQMGLAEEKHTGVWTLDPQLEPKLRSMGERGDIIVTMNKVMRAHGMDRAAGDFAIFSGARKSEPVIGRVVDVGIADEMTDRKYLVVDGLDGRIHYAESGKLEPHATPERGMIVALSGTSGKGRLRNAQVEIVSYLPLERLDTIDAATWLDKTIVADKRPALRDKGFGADVSKALVNRETWLMAKGLALSEAVGMITPRPAMLRELEQRALARMSQQLSAEFGLPRAALNEGARFQGQHVRTIDLPTKRIAVIKGRDAYALVEWQPELMKLRGKDIAISVRDHAITMTLARGKVRDLGLSR
jgi:type IV secretory pathway VirD2 relaxase